MVAAMAGDALQQIPSFADRLADAARSKTLPLFRAGATIYNKAGVLFDPVTDADREAERLMREMITAVRPEDGVLGEEFGETNPDAPGRWVIDPVDGTQAFICGVHSWTTLIAFEQDETPVFGLIDQPFTDERWTGFVAGADAADGALYRRGADSAYVKTSGCEDLSKARIATTDPRRSIYFTPAEAEAFEAVAAASRVARFGLDAYAYALLASGQFDLVVEAGLKHHDYAALAPVVRAAGGVITNWRGENPGTDDRGQIVAAASPALHAQAVAILSKFV